MTLPPPPPGYEQRMPRWAEPKELRVVGQDAFGREFRLTPGAADALIALLEGASRARVRLLLISGFRSIQRQTEIVRRKLDDGLPLQAILEANAYPGHSEHHTGRAVDFGSPDCEHLTEAFENTAEFCWLHEHARDFGFSLSYPRGNPFGLVYEPWHWCHRH